MMKVNNKPMRDRIVALVRANPSLADDDKKLIACVWYEEGIIKPSKAVQEARYKDFKQARMDV